MSGAFVAGLDLAERFYTDVVASLLTVPHAACLLGEGSEVLGFDTPRSQDHEWGPRVQLLVAPEHVENTVARIERSLPDTFEGFPTHWFRLATGTVTHHLEVSTVHAWVVTTLGFDPRAGMDVARWLATPQQRLLQVTAGRVFRDDTGELTRIREALRWYPDDVWRWMMVSGWHLVGNTQPLRARSLETGDLLGARLLTAKLCRLIMDLAFLQERRYHPYDKWYGAAFARLAAAGTLAPLVEAAITSSDPTMAGEAINAALVHLGHRHNELGISEPVTPQVGQFEVGINEAVRPYEVSNAGAYMSSLRAAIADPGLRQTMQVGAIDQLTHADDVVVTHTDWPDHLAEDYREEMRHQPVRE